MLTTKNYKVTKEIIVYGNNSNTQVEIIPDMIVVIRYGNSYPEVFSNSICEWCSLVNIDIPEYFTELLINTDRPKDKHSEWDMYIDIQNVLKEYGYEVEPHVVVKHLVEMLNS